MPYHEAWTDVLESDPTLCFFFFFFVDWGQKVDVVGSCFLDLASNYQPPEPLVNWLNAGPKPIYIGFGSLVSLENSNFTIICSPFLPWLLTCFLGFDTHKKVASLLDFVYL